MSLVRDNLNAGKSWGDDPVVEWCACGHADCSAKTPQVANPLEPLCEICVATRDAVKRVGMINVENESPDTDKPKRQNRKRLTTGQKMQMIDKGMPDLGSLYTVFDDLSRMVLAVDNVESNPCAMKLIGALNELSIELGSSPDQAAVGDIAEWAVVEDRENVADPLSFDVEKIILEVTTRKRKGIIGTTRLRRAGSHPCVRSDTTTDAGVKQFQSKTVSPLSVIRTMIVA